MDTRYNDAEARWVLFRHEDHTDVDRLVRTYLRGLADRMDFDGHADDALAE